MLRSRIFPLICGGLILWSFSVLGAELEPLKAPPLLDKTFVGCPDTPVSRTRTIRLVTRESVRHDVGPYSVRLPGYATTLSNAGHDSYAPLRIEACPGDTMSIDLINQLSSADYQSDTNLHTHGLIVTPTPNNPGPPGDYIFMTVPPGTTEGYRIPIPSKLPGTMFGKSTVSQPYPSGLYWFHAHRHMYARSQVQAGDAGVLSIGNPLAIIYYDDQGKAVVQHLPSDTQTSYLALRDIQLAAPSALRPSMASGQTAEWINGKDGLPDYDPTACDGANVWFEHGACGHGGLAVNGQTRELVWLFTVNGQQFPKISHAATRPQLWRIANLSSNVTYVLEVAEGENPGPNAPTRQFFALALDGIIAGAPIENEPAELLGVSLNHLLLMPGSRAEIYLPPDECSGVATLRTTGIETGPGGNPAPTGDHWPAIELARIETTQSLNCAKSTAFSRAALARPAELNIRLPLRKAELSGPASGASAQKMLGLNHQISPNLIATTLSTLHPACVFLPPADAGISYRRRIVFKQDNASNQFMLGSEVVDASGTFVPGTKIDAQVFPDAMNSGSSGNLGTGK
jgi:FtsP/CotA-like multicopper oxidase with cupredoxin domain